MEEPGKYPSKLSKGNISCVDFAEHIPLHMTSVFRHACDYRVKQIDYLIRSTVSGHDAEISEEELTDLHTAVMVAYHDGEISDTDYYSSYGINYTPVNLAVAKERKTAFDKAFEFASFQDKDKPVSDLELYKSLYKTRIYTKVDKQEEERLLNSLLEKQRILISCGMEPEFDPDAQEIGFVSYNDSEKDLYMLDGVYESAVSDVFTLFRVAQFEMLNDWEKQATARQLRNRFATPEFIWPDKPQKNTVYDMFEANVVSMLRHHKTFSHAEKEFGANALCSMVDDNIVSSFFEFAQEYLYYSEKYGEDTKYHGFLESDAPKFGRKIEIKKYNDYLDGLDEDSVRFEMIQLPEEDYVSRIPSFSSMKFNRMTKERQDEFDARLNWEMSGIAGMNGFAPPPPAAYFREKSLKYDLYL